MKVNKEDRERVAESLEFAFLLMPAKVHTRIGKRRFEYHFVREPREGVQNFVSTAKSDIYHLRNPSCTANSQLAARNSAKKAIPNKMKEVINFRNFGTGCRTIATKEPKNRND